MEQKNKQTNIKLVQQYTKKALQQFNLSHYTMTKWPKGLDTTGNDSWKVFAEGKPGQDCIWFTWRSMLRGEGMSEQIMHFFFHSFLTFFYYCFLAEKETAEEEEMCRTGEARMAGWMPSHHTALLTLATCQECSGSVGLQRIASERSDTRTLVQIGIKR